MMKYTINGVAKALLLGGVLVGASPGLYAAADVVTGCKSFRDLFPTDFEETFGNLGQCVSFFRTFPVETCQMLAEDDRLDDFGFANQGECIVELSQ